MYAHKHICRQGSFDIFDAEQGHYTRTIRQMQTNILSTTLDVDYIAYPDKRDLVVGAYRDMLIVAL